MKRGREEENNINGTTARKNTLAATKNNNEEERRRFEFERQMKELNEKFLEAFARSVREHPRAIKNNLMRQYLQFVKKLAMEYADVIASSKEEAQQKGGLLWILVPTETLGNSALAPTQARENSSTNSYDHDCYKKAVF